MTTRRQLVAVVRRLAHKKRAELAAVRAVARDAEQQEFWTALIRSMATMGRSTGWDGLKDASQRSAISYDRLLPLSRDARTRILDRVLRAAHVRMPSKKADWLARNVDIVSAMGGPAEVDRLIDGATDRATVIKLLRRLCGIGPKYARNLPMDRHHPAFRDSIAIDVRIKSISENLGIQRRAYCDQEDYYREVARDAGMEAWLLDRILYNFTADVLAALRSD